MPRTIMEQCYGNSRYPLIHGTLPNHKETARCIEDSVRPPFFRRIVEHMFCQKNRDALCNAFGCLRHPKFLVMIVLVFFLIPAGCGGGGGGGSGANGSGPLVDPGQNPLPEPDPAPIYSPKSAGGIPVDGFPTWEERAFLVVTNMVRMDPRGYRDTFMNDGNILLEQNYPIAGPLYWNHELNRSARYHAEDMASQDYFAHDSLDGTLWHERIRFFYPEAASLWENLAAGTIDPMDTLNLLLCEGSPPCAPDLSSEDGHRQNMMAADARELGTGYALDALSTYHRYWVQDFAGNTPMAQPPLVAGSHITIGTDVYFLLNYSSNDSLDPRDIRIVLDGLVYPLSLNLGDGAAGTYAIAMAGFSGCSTYYFEAVDGTGDAWRYPGSGSLATYGVAGCQSDYIP